MPNPHQIPATSTSDHDGIVPPRKAGLLLGLFLSGFSAVVVSAAVPQFREVLSAFGAELPWLSRAVLSGYWAVWLLPAGVLGVWFGWPNVNERRVVAVAIGIFSLLVVLPVSLVALYLPIFKLAAAA